jgi:thiamine monophosphate kinase
VSHVTQSERDVTEQRDSDTAPLRSGGVTITRVDALAEAWCLCWSHRQNAVHIEQLRRHLSSNRESYAANAGGDYRLLFVGSEDECSAAADAIRGTLADRARVAA